MAEANMSKLVAVVFDDCSKAEEARAALHRMGGKLTDHGIANSFIAKVKKEVGPGTAALIVLARSDDERRGKAIERLEVFKPTIIESDLPDEVEREITKALEHEQMASV